MGLVPCFRLRKHVCSCLRGGPGRLVESAETRGRHGLPANRVTSKGADNLEATQPLQCPRRDVPLCVWRPEGSQALSRGRSPRKAGLKISEPRRGEGLYPRVERRRFGRRGTRGSRILILSFCPGGAKEARCRRRGVSSAPLGQICETTSFHGLHAACLTAGCVSPVATFRRPVGAYSSKAPVPGLRPRLSAVRPLRGGAALRLRWWIPPCNSALSSAP